MAATGRPEVAWLPLHGLPPALSEWLMTPRFVRELGASYMEDQLMTLRHVPTAFDAVAVIKTVHDSSPTPTGVRSFKH